MKQTRIIMDMPVTVEIVDNKVKESQMDEVFRYFTYIDQTFSTFKKESEISRINRGELKQESYSRDMRTVFDLGKRTAKESGGYFDMNFAGFLDPSGIVKGWAISQAAGLLKKQGFEDYYVDAGGDIQVSGHGRSGHKWRIGIRNPFYRQEYVKIVNLTDSGIATSGTYIRGQHIYNPLKGNYQIDEILSLTVIGPDVADADRFATAAFAMGRKGIGFIEKLPGFEGYMIDDRGIATMTSGFANFTYMDDGSD